METKYGTLIRWTERNFGFIREDESGQDIFTHVSGFAAKVALPKNTRVKFNIGTRNGNQIAVNVEPIVPVAPITPVVGSNS
jgi:cold shock CspA family protein